MVIILNTIISTIEEIHAKRIIDKLSIISSTKIKVIRDSKEKIIDINSIVMDDILILSAGDQVVVDGDIISGEAEVNESFITGEEVSVYKSVNDRLLSGSFIESGKIIIKVIHIGTDNYTSLISKEAKVLKKQTTEMQKSFNKILKFISIFIIPLGIILFMKQFSINNDLENSIISTTAALIGMIPEGLILLTSSVLAISIIRLSKNKVLVQELYATENLARIDTICFDKTGTLTEGTMEIVDIIYKKDKNIVDDVLNTICYNSDDNNDTSIALKKVFNTKTNNVITKKKAFNSKCKYSSTTFNNNTYLLGAPECILVDSKEYLKYVDDYRVLVLYNESKKDILSYILIHDTIRKEAKDTINYLKKQNINIKIISGDNVKTIENIVKRCGMSNFRSCDMTNKVVESLNISDYDIFGRATPIQKKELIIKLQNEGHVVGMTGDGVNDVLALKEADISIGMGSGSDAAKNVSKLILLNNNFDSLPKILNEGRRSINNIQRSASLFLTKTIYSFLLTILFLFINYEYPFIPIQLTLTSMFTIGIPSFILALEPNNEIVKGNFLTNIISKSIPAALTIIFNIVTIMIIKTIFNIDSSISSTLCVIMTGLTGFILLYKICYPFNKLRTVLYTFLLTCFILGIVGFKSLLSLTSINLYMIIIIIILLILSILTFLNLDDLVTKKLKKKNN